MSAIDYNNAANTTENEKFTDKPMSNSFLGLNTDVDHNDSETSDTLTKLKVAKSKPEPANINDHKSQLKLMETLVMSMSRVTEMMRELAVKEADKKLSQSDIEMLNAEFPTILSKGLASSSAFKLGNLMDKDS